MCRDQAPSPADEVSELPALVVRQRGNVRENESPELRYVGSVEQAVMNHLERYARLDQSLVPSERVILYFVAGAIAPVEPCRLLLVYQTDACKRGFVA